MASKNPTYLPSVGRLLGFASADTTKLSDRRLSKHGLTVQQWVPLTALWQHAPLSESDLASYCRLSASSLNRLLDRMEAKELVRRSKDKQDRRRTLVALGPKGRRLSHLLHFYTEINEVLLRGMSARDRDNLVALLRKVVENLEEALHDDE